MLGVFLVWVYLCTIALGGCDTVAKWQSITSDYSGQYLAAYNTLGEIHVSHNYGTNWTMQYKVSKPNPTSTSMKILSNSTGEFCILLVGGDYGIYSSNNYGLNWTMINGSTDKYWYFMTMNSNGSIIYLSDYYYLYTSTDYGLTFVNVSMLPYTSMTALGCNGEGNQLVASYSYNYNTYTSYDYGLTWKYVSHLNTYFLSMSMSHSGQYILGFNQQGYLSTNYGKNWTFVNSIYIQYGGTQVAVSGEGDLMTIAVDGGSVYLNKNYGFYESWVAIPDSHGSYSCAACDYSGYRIALGQNPGALTIFNEIPTPTSMPSSQPSCSRGEGATNNEGGCEPCHPGTYVTALGGVCANCPKGYYSTGYEETECTKCAYPGTSVFSGSVDCKGFSLAASVKKTVVVMCILSFLVLAGVCSSVKRVAFLVHMIFPTLDLFSDIAYLMTNDFYVPVLFYLGVVFVVAPMPIFLLLLREHGALVPRFSCQLRHAWWLTSERLEEHCSGWYPVCPKAVVWVLATVAQLLWLVLYPAVMLLNVLFLLVWLFLGFFVHMSKTLAVGNVWNLWFTVWTGSTAYNTDIDIDTEQLNGSLQHEFYFETLPQFILQLSNNILLRSFTPVAIFSLAQSLFMAVNGCWRFFYYRLVVKKPLTLKEIPIDLTVRLTIDELKIDWLLLDGKIEPKSKSKPNAPQRLSGSALEDALMEEKLIEGERVSEKL